MIKFILSCFDLRNKKMLLHFLLICFCSTVRIYGQANKAHCCCCCYCCCCCFPCILLLVPTPSLLASASLRFFPYFSRFSRHLGFPLTSRTLYSRVPPHKLSCNDCRTLPHVSLWSRACYFHLPRFFFICRIPVLPSIDKDQTKRNEKCHHHNSASHVE